MKIIDAQVHIWGQTIKPPTGAHRKVSKFTAEELLKEMDEAGVDAALIHPPASWDPDSGALAIAAAKKYPDRFAVMGLLIPPVPPTTCPRRPARTDLFATAKPSYLMGDEERAAVDAETQRREHLRRPTTGAVMRLEKD